MTTNRVMWKKDVRKSGGSERQNDDNLAKCYSNQPPHESFSPTYTVTGRQPER